MAKFKYCSTEEKALMEKGAPAMTIFLALMLFAAGCSVMSAEEIITKSNNASLKADSYTLEL